MGDNNREIDVSYEVIYMQRVFVIDKNKDVLMPCHPARARELLNKGRAYVYKYKPFTIRLKYTKQFTGQEVEVKLDPGSKVTGLALIGKFKRGDKLIWAANLTHRGQAIKNAIESRRSLRRTRRARKTRYRIARFNNRTRVAGWLPPSLMSRVYNVQNWVKKLQALCPITHCHIETVRFDMQKIINPEISGIAYQQGELLGYEIREYLLEKWQRTCAYCGKKDAPMEIDHIIPKSRGGSNRVSNLTLACHSCNQSKGKQAISEFLSNKPAILKRIQTQTQAPLKDAAAVNATRYAIGKVIKDLNLSTSFWSGGRTKYNRTTQGYNKDHWTDAACVGEAGNNVYIPTTLKPLLITATGRGTRQVVRTDKYGFPRTKAGRIKRIHGLQTGDLVRLKQKTGKYAGIYVGRLAGIRSRGDFDIVTSRGKITSNFKNYTLLQPGDGYAYA
jgi:5-methylcytosine-specific restriction endonuclease McrA